MIGVGLCPAGLSPCGLGQPERGVSVDRRPLVDADGQMQTARLLDWTSGRYIFNASGNIVGMNATAQRVLLALLTVAGSSAVASLGLERLGGTVGANFVARRRANIARALSSLVTEGAISLVDVLVDVSARPIQTVVQWRDLTTQQEIRTAI